MTAFEQQLNEFDNEIIDQLTAAQVSVNKHDKGSILADRAQKQDEEQESMDAQIADLLNRMKLNNMASSPSVTSEAKPTTADKPADGGKLGDLMDDIENEFAELDELLKDVNLG